jgi:deoxyadenosine/deoxycytidine kinase
MQTAQTVQKRKKINIVSVDGSVGSGKSTLCEILKVHFKQDMDQKRVFFVGEPIEMWENFGGFNVFDAFIKKPDTSWKDILQLVIVSSQMVILKKTLE